MQITQLRWDKAARGAALAAKRNAVPNAFSISMLALENLGGSLEVEAQMYRQHNDFAAPFRSWNGQHELSQTFEWKCARVECKKQSLDIVWDGDNSAAGAPRRPFALKLSLEADQWAQIRWNGRFSGQDCGWWYEQTTLNVALCHSRPPRDLFLRHAPHAEIEQIAWLK